MAKLNEMEATLTKLQVPRKRITARSFSPGPIAHSQPR